MTAREVLDGIKGRLGAATPGPWKAEPVEQGRFAHIESRVYSLRGSHILLSPADGEAGQAKTNDANFIASAPSTVSRLTAAVESVLSRLDEWDSYKAFPDADETQVWYSAGKRHASEAIRALITEALEESQ